MVLVKCEVCNKKIGETRGKNIKRCKDCGRVVCYNCLVNYSCIECSANVDNIFTDYFAQKYKDIMIQNE